MRNDPLVAPGLAKRSFMGIRGEGFTRLELVVLVATFGILASLALPLLGNTSMRANQASCLNNLRQIGIAFQAWGNDHGDNRPWFVLTNEGGSYAHPLRDNAYIHYSVLSNYLSPVLLIDPIETHRSKRTATTWNLSPGGFLSLKNNALSYMFSPHTQISEATSILSSDRNVQFEYGSTCPYGGGIAAQVFANGLGFRGWTNGPHGSAGNVLVNDGRVEYADQARLKVINTQQGGSAANHVVTPF